MGTYLLSLFTSGALLFSGSAFAIESHQVCQPTSYSEFVQCAEKNSSEIKISEQELQSASKLEEIANQWINPELEADSVAKGSEKSETTASLLFTLRLGGKKSALSKEAKSEVQKAQATRDLNVQQTRLEIMLAAYRLSHIKSEIHLEEESVAIFTKIVTQYQRRAALSPEQDISLSIFKMAQADHQLRLNKLKADETKLLLSLSAATGITKEFIAKSLPNRKEKWPDIKDSADIESAPQIRLPEAALSVAKSQKDKADSEAWPDLKIGPTIRATKDGNESTTFVGVGLSMPLPVFTQNGGNRAYYSQKIIEAELALAQQKKKAIAARNELASRYNLTVQTLKNTLSLKALSEKHEQVERQFFKGLVSSSLVIEAHRQLFELEERRNSSELEALESYGQLLILENKFNEVIL